MNLDYKRFINRKIILITTIIFFVILFTGYKISEYASVELSVWIQTLGTLLGAFFGALLAGLISLKSVQEQINYQKTESAKNNSAIIVNSATHINFNFSLVVKEFQSLLTYLPSGSKLKNPTPYVSKELQYRLNTYKELLLRLQDLRDATQKIDIVKFPTDEYFKAEHIKLTISYRITDLVTVIEHIERSKKTDINYETLDLFNLVMRLRAELVGDIDSIPRDSEKIRDLKASHTEQKK